VVINPTWVGERGAKLSEHVPSFSQELLLRIEDMV
jgi:hypothetical protein